MMNHNQTQMRVSPFTPRQQCKALKRFQTKISIRYGFVIGITHPYVIHRIISIKKSMINISATPREPAPSLVGKITGTSLPL